jgi:polyisoprenoid-binding protein YceI
VRSAFAPLAVPLAALVASLVRWLVQGSGNIYTAFDKRFFVADPDLGWRISTEHPVWLGLDVCVVIAAIAAGLAIGGWIIRRREAKRGRRATVLRAASWILAVIPLAIPISAFASGRGPAGGRDTLPAAASVAIETGVTGALAVPAGRYEVVPHEGSWITAHLSAGHEVFDARFTKDLGGTWQGDPRDLTKPASADIRVAAASVDTGVGERSKHAREEYLLADKHPDIRFTLGAVIAARQDGPDQVAFRARGTVGLIGKTHEVEVTGTLKKPDATALSRLGITGDVLLVQGDFSLVIKETALAPDAGDFDGDRIPIHVSLVLRRTGG